MFRYRNEQNQPIKGLIQLEMKKSHKPLSPLANGQVWKTEKGYVHIWHIGKRLVDYKMMKQPGKKAVRTQVTGIDTLQQYLRSQKAVLVNASPA
jgi:hypothetical protein